MSNGGKDVMMQEDKCILPSDSCCVVSCLPLSRLTCTCRTRENGAGHSTFCQAETHYVTRQHHHRQPPNRHEECRPRRRWRHGVAHVVSTRKTIPQQADMSQCFQLFVHVHNERQIGCDSCVPLFDQPYRKLGLGLNPRQRWSVSCFVFGEAHDRNWQMVAIDCSPVGNLAH